MTITQQNNSHRKLKAFTLLELLVVVSIISLLFSMLLPSLSNAKALAKEVQCMANQRVCGMAIIFYANDNRSKLPSSETWIEDVLANIGGYAPDNPMEYSRETMPKALFCPCDPNPFPKPYMTGEMEMTSYMVNGAETDFAMGGGHKLQLGIFSGKCRLEHIFRESGCMMLGESSNYGKVVDVDHPAAQQVFAESGASISDARTRFHHRATSGFYHNSKMSIFYVDGHSEMLTGRPVDALPTSQWPGGAMMSPTTKFYPTLSLPTASEDPAFWGPPYSDWKGTP